MNETEVTSDMLRCPRVRKGKFFIKYFIKIIIFC